MVWPESGAPESDVLISLGVFTLGIYGVTINISKKVLNKAIWADKNGLVSGRLACTSSKTEILNKIEMWILNLNFQVNLECFFTQKT